MKERDLSATDKCRKFLVIVVSVRSMKGIEDRLTMIKIKIKINSGVAHSTQLEGRQPLRLRP